MVLPLLFLSSHPALAVDDWQPVLPEELKMTSEPKAPGAPAIYLYRQVDRNDQTGQENSYLRIKILTEEGRKNADVEIYFYKDLIEVRDIRARTIRPDGSIAEFDGKIYEKTIVKAKEVRFLAKTFTLPDVQVGSIIEYRFTQQWNPYLSFSSDWILSEELFTKHAKFSLRPNSVNAIRWSWNNLPPGTDPPKQEAGLIRLDAENIPSFPIEDYMPPADELKARVNFIYYDPSEAEKDQAKFWKEYGKKRNISIDAYVNKHKAMEKAVAEIVAPGDAPDVKLQKIYARVQQIKNLSYVAEKTEKEQKRDKLRDLNNIEDIWKQGYGYGYGLNWLFLGLARAAGFEAYPVLASARSNHFFHPSMMNTGELNSTLLLVKVNGKDVFCDPATKFAPYGVLPWSETGVPALRIEGEGGTWIQTPMPDSSQARIERKAVLALTAEGSLEGKLTVTFVGLSALGQRSDERDEDDAQRKQYLEDEVKEYIPVGAEVELTKQPDWSSSATTMVAEFKLTVAGWASGAGHRTVLAATLFGNSEKHTFEHAIRTHPIYFRYPYEEKDDVTIDLPLGWQVVSVPPANVKDAKVVFYALKTESGKNAVHVERDLKIDVVQLDAKYYGALRNFYELVRTGDDEQIVLQPI